MATLIELGKTWNIKVVTALPGSVTNLEKFMEDVAGLVDQEGYVVRFEDGHMFKVKAVEYLRFHKMLDILRNEKELIRLILDEKVDDIMPVIREDAREKVGRYESDLMHHMSGIAHQMNNIMLAARDEIAKHPLEPGGQKKMFAIDFATPQKHLSPMLFKLWDTNDFTFEGAWAQLKARVYQNCNTNTALEKARPLVGVVWHDYYISDLDKE